jgi:AsmA-like C-terminal region
MNLFTRPRHLDGFYKHTVMMWFSRHRKLVKKLLIWLGIPLALIFMAGFVPFSCDSLRHSVERAVVKAGASTCSVQKISLRPWFGFRMEGMEVEEKDAPVKVSTKIPQIRLAYSLLPLLLKIVVIKDVIVERPLISVTFPSSLTVHAATALQFSAEDFRSALSQIPFSVVVQNVSLKDADVSLAKKGDKLLRGEGVDLHMRVSYKKELAFSGRLSADTLTLNGMWNITNLRTSARVSGLSVTLDRCRGDFYGGDIAADGAADIGGNTLDRFKLELSHVNISKLYEACEVRRGQCDGRLDGKIVLAQSTLSADSIRGSGFVRMSDVSVHDMPLQSGIIVYIAVPQLRNITFKKLGTSMEVRSGKIFTPDISGDGYPLDTRADGWVGFDGRFSEKMKGIIAEDLVEKLHPVISRSLDDESEGKKSFSCTVHGTLANPGIDIDKAITDRAVHNVFDEVKKFFGNKK